MTLPKYWTEMRERLASCLREPDADEWLRQALEATWGVQDIAQLNPRQRALALQRASGVLLLIEDTYGYDLVKEPWYSTGVRPVVRSAFARYWQGHVLQGPPWSLGRDEPELPSHEQWVAYASFEGPADGPSMVPRRAETPPLEEPQRAEEESTSYLDVDSLGIEID